MTDCRDHYFAVQDAEVCGVVGGGGGGGDQRGARGPGGHQLPGVY